MKRFLAILFIPVVLLASLGATSRIDFKPLAAVRVIKSNGVELGYGFGASTDSARGTALLAAVADANASADTEVIEMQSGTFDIGSTGKIALGAGDSLKGQGKKATTIKGTALATTYGCVINPYSGNYIGKFTLDTSAATGACYPLGSYNQTGTYTADTKFTNLVLESVSFITALDSFYIQNSDGSAFVYSGTVRDCDFLGAWDHATFFGTSGAASGTIDFYDCNFTSDGTRTSPAQSTVRCVATSGLSNSYIVRFFNCTFACSGGTSTNHPIEVSGLSNTVELENPRITSSGTGAVDLTRSQGTLKVRGGSGSGTGGAFSSSGTITRESDLLNGTVASTTGKTLLAATDAATARSTISALASADIDTSSKLSAILTDETGSGAAVFGTSPTFNTSINIGGNCLLYPDGSNVLSLRNGANAQAFNIYNTWGNSGTDYERLFVGWTGNYCYLTTQRAGTGFARSIIVGTEGVTAMYLRTGGLDRWSVIGSGHLTAVTDNTYDIGASGATRPRSIYAGTNVETPAMSGTNTKTLTETTDTAFVNVTCATDTVVGGIIQYTIQADDGGAFQTRAGSIPFSLYKAGGSAAAGSFGTAADVVNTSSGTLTATWTVTGSGSTASLKCNATSSLTQTTLNIKYRVIINGPAVTVTPQ